MELTCKTKLLVCPSLSLSSPFLSIPSPCFIHTFFKNIKKSIEAWYNTPSLYLHFPLLPLCSPSLSPSTLLVCFLFTYFLQETNTLTPTCPYSTKAFPRTLLSLFSPPQKVTISCLPLPLSLFSARFYFHFHFFLNTLNTQIGEVQAASVHIWDEPENASTIVYNVDNFNEIHAATINKLVERLTSEKDHGMFLFLFGFLFSF